LPERPLLILDIDETLLHSRETPLARQSDLRAGEYHVYLRPHAQLFLASVSEYYDLAVWSSATKGYLKTVVDALMVDQKAPLLFVWDRSRCTRRMDFVEQETFFLKDLKKAHRKGFNLNRVLILEDEPRKVQRHYGNAVYVKPYEGEIDDDELLILAQYLQSICHIEDFRSLEKRSWRVHATQS
jgi:TFIIF-interacting CTD phosphatase-like protein